MAGVGLKRKEFDKRALRKAYAIGRVAARLFNAKTYLETSMDDVASAARISKGAIYHYFSSKSELLFFILDNYLTLFLEGLEEELDRLDGGEARLRFIIARHIELYANYVPEAKTLLHDLHCLPPAQFKVVAEKERLYYRVVAGVLAEVLPDSIQQDRLKVITFTLFGMCNWIYAWYNPKGSVKPEELSETIFSLLLTGVKGCKSGDSLLPRLSGD